MVGLVEKCKEVPQVNGEQIDANVLQHGRFGGGIFIVKRSVSFVVSTDANVLRHSKLICLWRRLQTTVNLGLV